MNTPASIDASAWLAKWWLSGTADTRVVESDLSWQCRGWGTVLLATVILCWLLVALVHRSRRTDITMPWRVVFGLLRAGIIAVPVLMLAQPQLNTRLERTEPRTLAILLDRSGSMSIRDGTESAPTSRWQRALASVSPIVVAASDKQAEPAGERFKVATYVFDETSAAADLDDLRAGEEPPAKRTAIGPGLRALRRDLAGESPAGVIVVSDGADNASPQDAQPLSVAKELGGAGIPVHTCLAGNDNPRDLSITVMADAPYAFAEDPVLLRASVEQHGFDGQPAAVTLMSGDQVLQTRDVELPAGGEPAVVHFEARPGEPGRKRYTIKAEPLPGELTAQNNTAGTEIQAVKQPIHLLYVERWPRWQYRFLRNALLRDPRFDCRFVLLTEDPTAPADERRTASFPSSEEELKAFDVIVLGDLAPQDLSPQQWQWTRDHVVDRGAGMVLIAGPVYMPAAFVDREIGPLLPFERVIAGGVDDADPFRLAPTSLGRHHPMMRWGEEDNSKSIWEGLPTLQWLVEIADVKPGAVVLAERPVAGAQPSPLVLYQRVGRGSVLFVGTDETWKWRFEVGNRYFYGFWGHAFQHVGMPHRIGQHRSVRIETPAENLVPDVPVNVSVSLEDPAGAGEAITLIAEPTAGGSPRSFKLQRAADSPFLFEGRITLAAEGSYRLFVEGFEDQGDAVVEVSTTGAADPELAQVRVNPALLRQMADVSGGRFVHLPELAALVNELDLSPLRYRWSQQIPLWDKWLTLAALTTLLTAEWILRKYRSLP